MEAALKTLQDVVSDPSIPWQNVVLGIAVGVNVFEAYIGSRQKPYFSPLRHPHIPSSLQPYLPASTSHSTYLKSQAYALAKLNYGSFMSFVDVFETYLLLTPTLSPVWNSLGLPRESTYGSLLQDAAKAIGSGGRKKEDWTLLAGFWDGACKFAEGEVARSVIFAGVLTMVGAVLSVPKTYYKNFVLEEKHGFNKMTRATFVLDQIKGLLISFAIELPVIAAIIAIIRWVGQDNVLSVVKYLMLFIFTFQLIMIPLYPYVISPLFNKFTPLPEESPVFPLVKELADRLEFPLGKVWVMDGSKRSAHSNAYFFGLPYLTKHIVIYDTLIEKSSPEEVQAILAHELGHWHGNHIPILLVTSLLQTSFSLLTFSLFLTSQPLLTAFGIQKAQQPATIVSLLLAASLFTPMMAVLHFLTNSITRTLEYDADQFAVKLGKEYAVNLKGALVSVHEENLAIYGVDWVYSAYNNSHPTLIERLEALDAHLDKEQTVSKKDK